MQKNKEVSLQHILNVNYFRQDILILKKENKQYIKGSRGHCSCFFKKPIIEGSFYMEFVGHFSEKLSQNYKYKPSFRVGVAPTQYYYNYPLGQDYSVGYKMNGSIIQQGKQIAKLQPYNFEDVIGIGMSINQVYKSRNKTKKAPNNFVQFFKNGKSVGPKLYLLTQDLYTFSASLYNESELQLNHTSSSLQYMPPNYTPYYHHLSQKSQYKDPQLEILEQQIIKIIKQQ